MLTVEFDRLALEPGDRVLDLGCGGGRHAFECLRRGATTLALDADEVELKEVMAVIAAMAEAGELPEPVPALAVRASALRLPFPDATFDRVIAAEVLEHIGDDTLAMGELARVLRPGGRLAVTVPRFFPELLNWLLSSAYHERPGGHVRIYRRRTLAKRLSRAGLRIVSSHHAHGLHAPYWWLRCAVGVDDEEHPLVRAYHRLLVRDIVRPSRVTRAADRLLTPLVGKSLVLYLEAVS